MGNFFEKSALYKPTKKVYDKKWIKEEKTLGESELKRRKKDDSLRKKERKKNMKGNKGRRERAKEWTGGREPQIQTQVI